MCIELGLIRRVYPTDKQTNILILLIYINISNALDSVQHQRLLPKIANIWINGEVHKWVKSLLSGRKRIVSVEGELSSWADAKRGIPQGSVPVLFVIFVNDMPDTVKSFCQLFDDDTKIFSNSDILQVDYSTAITLQ